MDHDPILPEEEVPNFCAFAYKGCAELEITFRNTAPPKLELNQVIPHIHDSLPSC